LASFISRDWQVVAVERQSQDLTQPDEPASLEIFSAVWPLLQR
jgi:hypothetical protein